MKRERNAKNAGSDSKSQKKTVSIYFTVSTFLYSLNFVKQNELAKNIICKTCFQTFLCTAREKA